MDIQKPGQRHDRRSRDTHCLANQNREQQLNSFDHATGIQWDPKEILDLQAWILSSNANRPARGETQSETG
ncbi:MAG: hypothetical protein P1U77_10820 [Rubripirellula sp.]|nr:hypothetical protein [Rubripirellula sp.]